MLDRRDAIARMQDEIAELRERVRLLEAALVGEWAPPTEWHLTRSESQVFRFLMRRERASRQAICTALFALRPDKDQPCDKIVDVHICRLRRKLDPFGVKIETIWGQGFALRDRQQWAARMQ